MLKPIAMYFACTILLAASPYSSLAADTSLFINEVMASNATTVTDLRGNYSDWIEIYNAGRTPVDVGGMYLTDDPEDATQWRFPDNEPAKTVIASRGYLLVWADGGSGTTWLHADFKLDSAGEHVLLFAADGQTLLDSLVFGPQSPDVSFGRHPDAGETLRFFGEPTPGAPNNEGYLGEVAPLRVSHERGFYDSPFLLTITCPTEGAEIIYTTDGAVPDDGVDRRFPPGRLYTGPMLVRTTLCLRVMAVKEGWKPTSVYTHTYIFNAPATVRSLPVISLVGDPGKSLYEPDGVMGIVGGSYVNGVWTSSGPDSHNNVMDRGLERPVSCEWISPDDNSGFQIDCGLRVHGSNYTRPRYVRQNGYWSGYGKFSLRLYFRGRYGANRLEYPLFPESDVDRFASIVLRAGHNDRTNPFVKDELLRRLHKDMGSRAAVGRFANLFVNGEYKGYFNPTEHVKDEACQEWFDSDKPWDVMTMSGIRDGDTQSWNRMLDFARTQNLSIAANYAEMGRRLDIPSFIDYLIIRLWPNDWDWPQNNWSAAAERSETGQWKFFVWDAEGTFVSSQLQVDRFAELNGQSNANGILFRALKANPGFRRLFADRLYKHFYNGGALTEENVRGRFLEMREELRTVIGNMDSYIITGWTPNRQQVFIDACRREGLYTFDGPTFAVNGLPQQGGHVAAGGLLGLTAPRNDMTVYYTVDGADPAGDSPSVAPTVITLVKRGDRKRILVPTGPDVGDWTNPRSFDDSAWLPAVGLPGGVGYERGTGYEAYISTDVGAQMYNINGSCYIRIPFLFSGDRAAINTMTLRMQYDDGFVAYLNGTEVARRNFQGVPAWNSVASAAHADTDAVVFESIDISSHLDQLRSGTNLLAIHGLNVPLTSSDFLIVAELDVAERPSIAPPGEAMLYTGPVPLTVSTHVKARAQLNGVWGALNEATFAVGPVAESLRISELMYHPADPNAEFVELTNVGSETIDLNLVQFTDGIRFTFPSADLAPGEYLLVAEDVAAFEATYAAGLPVIGQYSGKLSNSGERIELKDAAGATIQSFTYRDDWYPITDGMGFSLTAEDPAGTAGGDWSHKVAWRPSAVVGGSPGFDDTGHVLPLGTVVVNEVLANSQGIGPDWIELHNTTARAVNIGGWFLSDNANNLMRYEIAPGTTIPPYGYLVFTEDQHFGNEDDPGCHSPFGLSRHGEMVSLHSGSAGDLTGYSEWETFGPTEPGVTVGRYRTSTGTVEFVEMDEPTPGQANSAPRIGPVVISEIMYHPSVSGDAEYVELLNTSDADVTFYDFERDAPWRFVGDGGAAIEMLFPEEPPVTLGPGEYLMLVRNRAVFDAVYRITTSPVILEWGPGSLDNTAQAIRLDKPGDLDDDGQRQWIAIDRVAYSNGSQHDAFLGGHDPWPADAAGTGLSLTRTETDGYANDPANWHAAVDSAGAARRRPTP
ncbi:lamin tail domain-containing protein [Anaerobaca lacustris]|uniref:Lamin tail domain-containing protein n=1 Tax=Anaerobaca lacustris TaxID=3044600 RepID=A0AAW6TS02_9BACT|nr:lamin tail domain-containing protein [Sedimentisphaerales bacterium M17dextr]